MPSKKSVPPSPTAEKLAEKYLKTVLTKQQLEIARLALAGQARDQIASDLYVTADTVKTHIRHILKKTGARNVRDLLIRLVEQELTSALPSSADGLNSPRATPGTDQAKAKPEWDVLRQMARAGEPVSLVLLHLRGTDQVHVDPLVPDLSSLVRPLIRTQDVIFQQSHDTYVVVLNASVETAQAIGARLAHEMTSWLRQRVGPFDVQAAVVGLGPELEAAANPESLVGESV